VSNKRKVEKEYYVGIDREFLDSLFYEYMRFEGYFITIKFSSNRINFDKRFLGSKFKGKSFPKILLSFLELNRENLEKPTK